jgi:dUTP pyrophosphatase
MDLKIKLLDVNCAPTRAYTHDAGLDLYARIDELISIGQHQTIKIPTGICVEIPEGKVGLLLPRSSFNVKGLIEPIGTIDAGYRGEISACITNSTDEPYHLNPYDRIAQLVIVPFEQIDDITFVDELSPSERGEGGFGSSGK